MKKMINLDEYFEGGCAKIGMGPIKKRRVIPFPGTVEDFLIWLRGNHSSAKFQKEVESMRFDELEQLPVMKRLHIESIGASNYHSSQKVWRFMIREDSKNFKRGEGFTSRPSLDYNQAFMSGLILIWEMQTRRRQG